MKNKPLIYYATLALAGVFIVLRLIRVIVWSWWWVLSPVLIPFGVVFLFVVLSLILLRKYGRR